jgi:hypothetical protein
MVTMELEGLSMKLKKDEFLTFQVVVLVVRNILFKLGQCKQYKVLIQIFI